MMDTFASSRRSVKQESDRDSTDSPASDRRAAGSATVTSADESFDMQQQIQQLLAASSGGATSSNAALLSPLHFLQASAATSAAGGAATSLSIPWNMMPQYQMLLLAGQNAGATVGEDGQVLVMPTAGDGKGNGAVSAQQQLIDASLQMAIQQQLSAAAAAAGGEQALAALPQQMAAAATADQSQRARQAVQQQQQQQAALQRQQSQQQDASKSIPRPPKKPLTPYMMFSKSIWPQVKAANSHLSSVTEIGAIIGSLWRELGADEKQQYNEQFTKDKVRYDEEMRVYLKTNGLHPSDLIKARSKKKDISRPLPGSNMTASAAAGVAGHQSQAAAAASRTAAASANAAALSPAGHQLLQSLVGYQTDGQAASGQQRTTAADAAGANSLPNFSQAWAGQPVQQILAQMGLAGQVYANSDGTISVDNANLASLLALQPQLLQQAGLYTDQSGQMKLSPGKESSSWPQQNAGAAVQSTSGAAQPNGLANGSSEEAGGAQYSEYFTVNAQGQLVKHTTPVSGVNVAECLMRISQLETELLRLQSALLEKSQENDRLRQELNEAFRLVTEYRQQQQAAVAAVAAERSASATAVTTAATSAAATSD